MQVHLAGRPAGRPASRAASAGGCLLAGRLLLCLAGVSCEVLSKGGPFVASLWRPSGQPCMHLGLQRILVVFLIFLLMRAQLSPAPGSSTLPARVRWGRSAPSSFSSSAGRGQVGVEGGGGKEVRRQSRRAAAGGKEARKGMGDMLWRAPDHTPSTDAGKQAEAALLARLRRPAAAAAAAAAVSRRPLACVSGARHVGALLVVLQGLVPLRLPLQRQQQRDTRRQAEQSGAGVVL